MLKSQEVESERKVVDSDSSFHVETRSKVKRWAPVRPFRPFPEYTDSESMAESDTMETQTSYRFMRWKPRVTTKERVSIETSSKISQWPPSRTYPESDSESIASSEASSISFESRTKVKFWQPVVPPKPSRPKTSTYKEETTRYESMETGSISIDTSSKVSSPQLTRKSVKSEEETSITKKSEMKINLGRKPPKVASGFRMNIPGTDMPEQVDLGRSRSKTKFTRKTEQTMTFGAPAKRSDIQFEISEPEDEAKPRKQEGMMVFKRKSEQKITLEPQKRRQAPEGDRTEMLMPESEDEIRLRRSRSQETRTEFSRKTEQNIRLQSRAPKQPLPVKLDILPTDIDEERPRRRAMSQETLTKYSRKSEMDIIIVDTGEDSDSYYRKPNVIRKLPTPTPDKLIIQGELFPQKPEKQPRVRVRKQGQPKSSKYKPVPYVPAPSTLIIPEPERRDVLMAAENWDR